MDLYHFERFISSLLMMTVSHMHSPHTLEGGIASKITPPEGWNSSIIIDDLSPITYIYAESPPGHEHRPYEKPI